MIPKKENPQAFFDQCRRAVDETLDRLVPTDESEPGRLHRAIRWSLFAGGKRFRPALVIGAGEVFGAGRDRLLRTAAAIEMIHTYSLIHDDLPAMDDDDLRRGRETCHRKFGVATAILAGDALQNLAFQTIAEDSRLPAGVRVRLIAEIGRASGTPDGMVAGQQMDLDSEGKKVSVGKLERIHQSKTGAMIAVSATAGAIIAGAPAAETAAVAGYAAKLGLLFQITDDLLDVTQTTEVLGKTAGKDLTAEKATYPALYGVEETQQLAEDVYRRACRDLERIKRDTGLLSEVAGFILERRK